MPKSAWIEPPEVPADAPRLHEDPLLNALLWRRGLAPPQVAEFFNPSARGIPDPTLAPGLEAACERVRRAIAARETVALFGDYDADGACSMAILKLALGAASDGALPAMAELPSRSAGYGLNRAVIDRFAAGGATLLIAADCASSDHEHVAYARSLGMDVVILDHHVIHGQPPEGAIVASPRLVPDNVYRNVPAAALCLLLATALARAGLDVGRGPGRDPDHLLDLAMIAVVADVCDLRDPVNRALVRDGLRLTRVQPRPGVAALARAVKVEPGEIDTRKVGMQLAPALNAAGRKASAEPALALLLAASAGEAAGPVQSVLESLGWVRERRARLKAALLGDLERDERWRERPVLVFEAEDCPHGVAGALASDLVKSVGRPVIVLSPDGEAWRGSARSAGGFDIGGALRESDDLLIRTGGHRMAAGLMVRRDRLAELRERLESIARDRGFVARDGGELEIHADLPADRITLQTLKAIDTLRPFGEGNPEPLLRVRGAELRGAYVMGQDQTHLKLQLSTPQGPVSAILWGEAGRIGEIAGARRVDVAGQLRKNVYNGAATAQLICEDFRPAP